MSRYILVRRLRGPLFLLLVGVNALLAQQNILGWGQSWPLYLILAGLLMLAERAALASEDDPPYPWGTGAGMNPGTGAGANPYANSGAAHTGAPVDGGSLRVTPTSTSVVPSGWQEMENKKEGGQS